ncbi:MAG: menaquinone biosynthetic enzyme MqnA/MqnD family protein [Tenuifilaceae bacterium]
MTQRIKVTAVSYLNTAPFVYGLQHTSIRDQIDLSLDYPAECARKVASGEVDLGLVPIAAIPSIPLYNIVTDYCIGTEGPVRTVVLLSNSPIETLERIYLDYQSRTSVVLVKILSQSLWKIKPEWVPFTPHHTSKDIDPYEGVVIIGDRVFELESNFKYRYDLAEEWIRLTGLPFVFAAWTANKQLDPAFLATFNSSLRYGIESIPASIDFFSQSKLSKLESEFYLQNNISYNFNQQKREALKLFWSLAQEFKPG